MDKKWLEDIFEKSKKIDFLTSKCLVTMTNPPQKYRFGCKKTQKMLESYFYVCNLFPDKILVVKS